MIMTLRQLECAVAVADEGRIGKAARRLLVSQPYLSATIGQLEAELGRTLFRRSRAGVEPTAEGRELLRSARLILREVERIRAAPSADGPLEIATYFLTYVMDAFLRFRHDRPVDGRDRLTEMGNHEVIEAVASASAELGIILHAVEKTGKFEGAASRHGLELSPLFGPLETCAIMAPSHPLAARGAVTIEELRAWPLVSYDDESTTIYIIDHLGMPPGLPRLSVSDRGRFLDALDTGLWWSCVFMPMGPRRSHYHIAPIEGAELLVQADLVIREGRRLSPREEAFLEVLRGVGGGG